MIKLRYGNTNTFYIPGAGGGLLIDTDYAGTLPQLFKAIKSANITTGDIAYVAITHCHPDHVGLVGELQSLGVKLLLIDVQKSSVHFPDSIFRREGRGTYKPIDVDGAVVISCADSRGFLRGIGIDGEIISTPSHSADSVSFILDGGDCFVGDLEPYEYLDAYDNPALRRDWERILSFHPKKVYYSHVNERIF